ncbi:hypothetical protein Q8F55_006132 [Vanrija albida]|uniref:Knr4/Smi1-like domain-containing protein n=1 Tax=Vanrija albida TaxID=181172 RepID=A0ABR3PX80_9TREE
MDAQDYIKAVLQIYKSFSLTLPLHTGADDPLLDQVQDKFGHADLLAPLIELWRTANGSDDYAPVFVNPGFLTGYDLFSIDDALSAYDGMRVRAPQYEGYDDPEPRDPRLAPGWWQPGWLPFAGFGGATLLLLVDLSPGAKGQKGQVIAYTHDPDQMTFVAGSLPEFFKASAVDFEQEGEEILEGLIEELE